jgi:hypothetical protein
MPPNTYSDTPRHGIPASAAGHQRQAEICPGEPDDDLLAALLIRMWALASGRSLRSDVPATQLSEDELISFWADDMSPPSGRHATEAKPDRAMREQMPAKGDRSPRGPRGKARRASPVKLASGHRERPVDPAAA